MDQSLNTYKQMLLAFGFVFFVAIHSTKAQMLPKLQPNFLQLPQENFEINFKWQTDSVNSKAQLRSALLLPVKIPGCSRQFYMQFDLGAPSTLFYKHTLQDIQSKYGKVKMVSDTAKEVFNYKLIVGTMPVVATEARIIDYRSGKINWSDRNSIEIIGTIGADFIEDRVIIFDYRNERIFNRINIPKQFLQGVSFSDFIFVGRSVLLPSKIRGKNSLLFFDTGSSAYQLLTDKKTTELLAAPGATPIESFSRSWDKMLKATTIATNDSIEVASIKLPINYVTFMEGSSEAQISQMMKMGIGGMTGNTLFLKSVLILDTKNKKFGVVGERR